MANEPGGLRFDVNLGQCRDTVTGWFDEESKEVGNGSSNIWAPDSAW